MRPASISNRVASLATTAAAINLSREEIAAHIAARERHQRRRAQTMTPKQRLQAMQDLIARSWEILRANPHALAHFHSRNHRKRAISSAQEAPHGT